MTSPTIRQSLLRNLVAVTVVLGGAILAVTFFGSRAAVRRLSGSLITGAVQQAEARLRGFFEPVLEQVLVARSWERAGLIDTDDVDTVNGLFVPLMRQLPAVTSVLVADDRGREILLLRSGGTWRNRRTRRDEWGDRTEWREWSDAEPAPVRSTRVLDYDPRRRPWFEGAVARLAAADPAAPLRDLVFWTKPYQFFTTREPGMTASIAGVDADGVHHVIGLDMLLRDISTFTQSLTVTPNGKVFVLSEDILVIGLPADDRFADAESRQSALLQRPEELGLDVATDATHAFGTDRPPADEPIRFESGGRWWWGQMRPFPLTTDRALWIAVVVPESDLLGNLVTMRLWIIAITLTVLAAAITRVFFLARRYSRPIEALVRESGRISRGDLEPGAEIASGLREVRRLADAHERMREGLRSLMKLERDLQLARQIQQQTFPAHLPVLRGYDLEAWSEPAEETGGDTYDVIGDAPDVARAGGGAGRTPTPDRADRVVLLLADATGHGIGPALSVTQVRAMLRIAVRFRADLLAVAREINQALCADLPSGRFITAWLGELDAGAHTLTSFSAGQAPLLHYHADRDDFDVLRADTVPLGILETFPDSAAAPRSLARGDVFAVLSDGIFEAMDPDDDLFGTERVQRVIAEHRRGTAAEILSALRDAVDAFARGRSADDDRTAIIVKRRD